MVGAIDLNRPKCVCLRRLGGSGEPPLPYRKSKRAQIVARLIEAATAERLHEFAPVLQAFRIDFPVAPREEIVGKRKRARIFVLEHRHGLIGLPLMFRRKDCGSQHIEKSVHLRFHFVSKLPDWMMQPSRKLDRELMRRCRYQSACDLRRSWKCISRHSAGSQFVTEFCRTSSPELCPAINAMVCSALSGGASQNTGNSPTIALASLREAESTSSGKNISR